MRQSPRLRAVSRSTSLVCASRLTARYAHHMDTRQATAALVAGTTGFACWCEQEAQVLDKIHAATEHRPMSPQECRQSLDAHREMLRRVGQLQVQWLTLLPGVLLESPPVPPPSYAPAAQVGRVRRWLRRVVG